MKAICTPQEHVSRRAFLKGALMTGSGSCFFGIAANEDTAAAAAREVERAGLGRTWTSRTRASAAVVQSTSE